MSNIARFLKEEIVRVVRKEFRGEADSLKRSWLRYRSEIATVNGGLATLERQAARLGKLLAKGGSAAVGVLSGDAAVRGLVFADSRDLGLHSSWPTPCQ